MTFTIEATYENGVLRPARPLPLRKCEKVEIVVNTPHGHSETDPVPFADLRPEALKRLLALNLPVADWDQMDEEIVRGVVE